MMTLKELKEYKEYLGLSNKKLAGLSGVPLGTLQKVLSGETGRPRYETMSRIEQALINELARDTRYNRLKSIGSYGTLIFHEDSSAYEYYAEDDDQVTDVVEDARLHNWRRQGTYTAVDYDSIPEDIRVELIDGVIYDMGVPTPVHQHIIISVASAMFEYRRTSGHKNCMPFMSPIDVQLNDDDMTIVQPDVIIVCRKGDKDISRRIHGAPDFIMEVLSPSTRRRDMQTKCSKYAGAGVREYWIVDPDEQKILVFDFENLRFPVTYTFHDTVPVLISGGELKIDFNSIREDIEDFFEI